VAPLLAAVKINVQMKRTNILKYKSQRGKNIIDEYSRVLNICPIPHHIDCVYTSISLHLSIYIYFKYRQT